MFNYENFLPLGAFNESSVFFKASEVFRYGFLLEDISTPESCMQLYSYNTYYVEIIFGDNYEEIKSINGITVDEALDNYTSEKSFFGAMAELVG